MRVADVMTTEVVTARPDTPLKEAARLLVEAGVSGLPVVDEEDRVVGVVTEADFLERQVSRDDGARGLLQLLFGGRQSLEEAETVGEAMTDRVATVRPDATVTEAARIMADRRVNRLPVVDADRRLVGIVSRADVVGAFARPDQEVTREIREGILDRIAPLADAPVSVTTRDGVVTLEGTVGTRTEAELVAELVGRVHGVVRVENGLEWEVDDARAEQAQSWALYHPHDPDDPAPGQERQGPPA